MGMGSGEEQHWRFLVAVAESVGEDLWGFEGSKGQSIQGAMAWLLPHLGRARPCQQMDAFDADRFYPIY